MLNSFLTQMRSDAAKGFADTIYELRWLVITLIIIISIFIDYKIAPIFGFEGYSIKRHVIFFIIPVVILGFIAIWIYKSARGMVI